VLTADEVRALDRASLGVLLREGHSIDAASLANTRYRGTSLGLPAFVERLTWKTFRKVFHHDAARNELRGWNVRVEQRGIDDETVPLRRGGRAVSFGHYRVVEPHARQVPSGCDRGLLIDYGAYERGPMGRVRDPIVAVNEGSNELLLGWSYVDVGFATMGTPIFFTLQREGDLDEVVAIPRSRRRATLAGATFSR
jgi:hypothetical protein